MRSLLLTPPPLRKAAQPTTVDTSAKSSTRAAGRIYRRDGDIFVRRAPLEPTNGRPLSWFETHRYSAFRKNGKSPVSISLAEALPAFGIKTYLDVHKKWMGLPRPHYVETFMPDPLVGELDVKKLLGIQAAPHFIDARMYTIEHDDNVLRAVIPKNVHRGRRHISQLIDRLYKIPSALLRFGRVIIFLPPEEPFFGHDDGAEYRAGGLITMGDDNNVDLGFLIHELAHGLLTDTPAAYQRELKTAIRFAVAADGTCGLTEHAHSDEEEALCEGFRYFDEAGPAMRQLALNVLSEKRWKPKIRQPRLKRILKLRRA